VGFELRREVRDLLPRGGTLTDKECRLILELADNCHEQTRQGWPGAEWLADKCDIPKAKRVGEFFASIAKKWVELRVEIGKDSRGKPFYSTPLKRVTYRIPTRTELLATCPDKVPPLPGPSPCKLPPTPGPKVPVTEGPKVPPTPGASSPQRGDPSPQGFPQGSSSKNPSSLSPREGATDEGALEPTPDRERDQLASHETQIDQMLTSAGTPADQLGEVREEITRRHEPRGIAWWRKVHANGDLRVLVAEVLQDLAGTGPGQTRADFMASLAGEPGCDHGIPGGNVPWEVDGWMHCSTCRRSSGWTDTNVQGRTDDKAPRRIRSPADQRVAENQPLYEKYRRLEEAQAALKA
jgi:hypothetical protein